MEVSLLAEIQQKVGWQPGLLQKVEDKGIQKQGIFHIVHAWGVIWLLAILGILCEEFSISLFVVCTRSYFTLSFMFTVYKMFSTWLNIY